MKRLSVLIVFMSVVIGFAPVVNAQPVIVGVWELTELRLPRSAQPPPVEITNKKDIYTEDGHYHNTAPDSTEMTDVDLRSYSINDGVLTVYGADGSKQLDGRVVFLSGKLMEITDPEGAVIVFKKISENPNIIPMLQEKAVRVSFPEQ
jgi:hypothetical protein